MSNTIQRLGVLTSGGDCPGLNAVIRAVVKTAINEYEWEVVGIEDGFEGLIKPDKVRSLTLTEVRGLLPRGGTILGTGQRGNPFRPPAGANGQAIVDDGPETVIRHIREYGIDGLIVIGGDGSLRLTYELMTRGLKAIAVPKTIDNDLYGTEAPCGFDTAVNTAMEALDKLHSTAESHHRVLIVELMGRHAGWIALSAGIAGGADVILIPEIPYSLEAIVDKINQRNQSGARFSIVVVAEGSTPFGGAAIYQEERVVHGVRRLGGIGEVVAAQLQQVCEAEVRVTVLGHIQRGGSPSAFDRLLGTRFGAMAVHFMAQDKVGHMVALRHGRIMPVPISEVVSRSKRVLLDNDLILAALGLGICLGNSRQAIVAMQERERDEQAGVRLRSR